MAANCSLVVDFSINGDGNIDHLSGGGLLTPSSPAAAAVADAAAADAAKDAAAAAKDAVGESRSTKYLHPPP